MAGKNTLSFSLLECLVISKCTNRAQKVRHTYSCCLLHSLPFVPEVHSFFLLWVPLYPRKQGHTDYAGFHWWAVGCHPGVRCPVLEQSQHLSGLCFLWAVSASNFSSVVLESLPYGECQVLHRFHMELIGIKSNSSFLNSWGHDNSWLFGFSMCSDSIFEAAANVMGLDWMRCKEKSFLLWTSSYHSGHCMP